LLGGACWVGAAPLSAAGVPPGQLHEGSASASFSYSVYTGARTESGSYTSDGQLGSGQFQLVTRTATGAGCTLADHFTETARFVRSDGAVLSGTVTSGGRNCGVPSGETLSITLNHGTRELVNAQLTLVRESAAPSVTPSGGIGFESFALGGTVTVSSLIGYRLISSTPDNVTVFGGTVPYQGQVITSGARTLNAQHIELTPSTEGYWIVDHDGHVFGLGDAAWLGNADRRAFVLGEAVVSLARTPSGHGYWLFTDHGRVQAFGDAPRFGDVHAIALHAPVVGAVATPTGRGYYMVASDGGVFAFGDAHFLGSMGGVRLAQPVVGMAVARRGPGYWLAASDGGVFSFHAPFRGSLGALHLAAPITSMAAYGNGYLVAGADGGVFNFSTNPFFTISAPVPVPEQVPGTDRIVPSPIVSIAAIG
jgi:hypothetical protein